MRIDEIELTGKNTEADRTQHFLEQPNRTPGTLVFNLLINITFPV